MALGSFHQQALFLCKTKLNQTESLESGRGVCPCLRERMYPDKLVTNTEPQTNLDLNLHYTENIIP